MPRDINDVMRSGGASAVVALPRKKRDNAREAPKTWEDGLAYGVNGKLANTAGNVALILLHHPLWVGVLGFNEMQQRPVWLALPPKVQGLNGPKIGDELGDVHIVAVQQWLHLLYNVRFSIEAVQLGVLTAAHERSFHPVREYLDSLPAWDGTARLDTLLIDHGGADDDLFVRAVTGKTFIGAVARVRKPGEKMDTMLVLEGPQGLYKSELLRALAGDDHFDDHLPDLRDKDAALHLGGLWICEVAELDALRAAENSRIKSFMSRRVDRYRPPYGRHEVTVPRSCVFIGTTNGTEYLTDPTGGRRFWPVRITKRFDLAAITNIRDQLWAEADHRFKAGEKWYLDADQEKLAAVEQDDRRVRDPWEAVLGPQLQGHRKVTVEECCRLLSLEPDKQDAGKTRRIASVLRGMGFTRERGKATEGADGTRTRPWVYVRNEDTDAGEPF